MKTLLLALALLAPGCLFQRSTVNQPVEPAAVSRLVPGQSTAREVVEELGAPTEVVQLGRRSAYRYDHRVEKQSALFLLLIAFRGLDANSDRVWVFFDENDVLTHVGATFESSDAAYRLPVFQQAK